jgi:hypothetical protein
VLGRSQVGLYATSLPALANNIPFLDIYIVADAEGKEMVLKLHRYR